VFISCLGDLFADEESGVRGLEEGFEVVWGGVIWEHHLEGEPAHLEVCHVDLRGG